MNIKETWPYYLANEPVTPNSDLVVTDKYTGEAAAKAALANPAAIDRGIAACVDAAEPFARMRPYERQAILPHDSTGQTRSPSGLMQRACYHRCNLWRATPAET